MLPQLKIHAFDNFALVLHAPTSDRLFTEINLDCVLDKTDHMEAHYSERIIKGLNGRVPFKKKRGVVASRRLI